MGYYFTINFCILVANVSQMGYNLFVYLSVIIQKSEKSDLFMNIREISSQEITQTVKNLFLQCNYFIGDDVMNALISAREREESQIAKDVLTQIIDNDNIAASEQIPMCQDTGMAILFVEYGDRVVVDGDGFEAAVQEGVRRAYTDGYLRKSVVSDPVFDRVNTKDNTPAIIHTKIVHGDKISITAGGKGFGSENMSAVKMLTPSAGVEGVKDFVLDAVRYAGPNPCPPIVVGVGLGGTFEKSAQLAKMATFRAVGSHNPDERYAALESELLEKINEMGTGPAGLGGLTTALAVNIETYPTHIAGMPAAVNICCHACRHSHAVI